MIYKNLHVVTFLKFYTQIIQRQGITDIDLSKPAAIDLTRLHRFATLVAMNFCTHLPIESKIIEFDVDTLYFTTSDNDGAMIEGIECDYDFVYAVYPAGAIGHIKQIMLFDGEKIVRSRGTIMARRDIAQVCKDALDIFWQQ